jgi:hypothetical protein
VAAEIIAGLGVTTRRAEALKIPETTRHACTSVAEGGHECPENAVVVNELLQVYRREVLEPLVNELQTA